MTKTRDNHPEDWYAFSKHVVQALAKEAKDKGVTRRELAAAMGVTYEAFSGWINGKRGMPTVGAVYAGCGLVGVDVRDVVSTGYAAFLNDVAPVPSSLDAKRAAKKRSAEAEAAADSIEENEQAAAQTPPRDSDIR